MAVRAAVRRLDAGLSMPQKSLLRIMNVHQTDCDSKGMYIRSCHRLDARVGVSIDSFRLSS